MLTLCMTEYPYICACVFEPRLYEMSASSLMSDRRTTRRICKLNQTAKFRVSTSGKILRPRPELSPVRKLSLVLASQPSEKRSGSLPTRVINRRILKEKERGGGTARMDEVLGELWNGEEECRLECICGEGARRRRDWERKRQMDRRNIRRKEREEERKQMK